MTPLLLTFFPFPSRVSHDRCVITCAIPPAPKGITTEIDNGGLIMISRFHSNISWSQRSKGNSGSFFRPPVSENAPHLNYYGEHVVITIKRRPVKTNTNDGRVHLQMFRACPATFQTCQFLTVCRNSHREFASAYMRLLTIISVVVNAWLILSTCCHSPAPKQSYNSNADRR